MSDLPKQKRARMFDIAPKRKGGKKLSSFSHSLSYNPQPTPQPSVSSKPVLNSPSSRSVAPGRVASLSFSELHQELSRIKNAIESSQKEQDALWEQKHQLERGADKAKMDIIQLFEEKREVRSEYIALLEQVHRSAIMLRRENKKLTKQIAEKKDVFSALQQLVFGLRFRLLRNQKILWKEESTELREKIQTRLKTQETLAREIQILRAHKQKILASIRTATREDELVHFAQQKVIRPTSPAITMLNSLEPQSNIAQTVSQVTNLAVRESLKENEKQNDEEKKSLESDLALLVVSKGKERQRRIQLRARLKELQRKETQIEKSLASLRSDLSRTREETQRTLEQKALEEKQKLELAVVKFSPPLRQVSKESLLAPKPKKEKKSQEKQKREKAKPEKREQKHVLRNFLQKLRPSFVVFVIMALVLPGTVGALAYANRGLAAKGYVLGAATNAINGAKSAGGDIAKSDFDAASQKFQGSASALLSAQSALRSIGPNIINVTRGIPYVGQIKTADALVDGAKNLSEASALITEAADAFQGTGDILPAKLTGQKASKSKTTSEATNQSFVEAIQQTQENVARADQLLLQANQDFHDVKISDLPVSYQDQARQVVELLPQLTSTFHQFAGFYSVLPKIFGATQVQRYLLMFQNNDELRGTGGFLGSFAVADVDQGKLKNLQVHGIYDPDGQLLDKVSPPSPLKLITPRWFMRDANWYPDFPTSAQKVLDFYERSDGPSADGAISFTPTIIQNLLTITGPVTVPEQHVTVDAENFLKTTQYKVEIDYDKELNQPKKFLGDMLPHLVQKLTSLPKEKWLSVLSVLTDSMSQKQILVYIRDATAEQQVIDAGLGGEIKNVPLDYLSIVNNNVFGNKTDLLIHESVQHNVTIESDGTVISEVTVTREHTGTDAWPSGRNRDFITVLVPKNSELLSYTGFDTLESKDQPLPCETCVSDPLVESVEGGKPFQNTGVTTYQEFGKTVFAGWQYLEPGAIKTYTLRYRLPFKVTTNFFHPAASYSLYVQKQSGSMGSKYRLQIGKPADNAFAAFVPKNFDDVAAVKQGSTLTFETTLTNDRFFGTVLEK